MATRNRLPLELLSNYLTCKLSYKASYSEINKDLVQINEAIGFPRKLENFNEPKKKIQKNEGRNKAKYTEEVSAILGLASLMNEKIETELGIRKPASEVQETLKIPKTRKTSALRKKRILKFARAATHIGIAYLIKEKKDKRNNN